MPIYLDTHLDCKNGRNITNLAAPDNTGKPLVFEDSFPVFNRNGHGFTVGTAIRHNGSIWVRADAQSAANLATHIVAKVIDANNFSAVSYHPNLIIGTHGITRGEIVYLSNTSGNLSGTAGTYSQIVGRAISSTGILVNIADPTIQTQLAHVLVATYFDMSDLPLVTWNSATQVTVSPGVAVCRHHLDPNDRRMWRLPSGIGSQITVTLPGGVSVGQTIYLWLGTTISGATTAFFDTSNVAANRPSGYDYVRLLTSFVLNGSAQIPTFVMDEERWIYSDFARETFIAGASWASKVIPGCPLGNVEVFGIASSGLPVNALTYSIRISLANPTTAAIAAPTSSMHSESLFNGNLSAYHVSASADSRSNTDNFFGIATDRLLWHYKTQPGGTYLSADYYPTVRLLKYRTAARQLT